ncbi:hypothetical protein CBR_g22101 [Chara braunii]|uniref:Protein kinase domain-containing protein n=1 Tax=Chara braunii TaxID=69332 RepID=A0A388L210_CHABU|nr:hypothetical protein CBR_g22101 [Chara braunii]|eukprot:GBG76354.1 hypothetical protein CBR_g22101 [Chara braunii]
MERRAGGNGICSDSRRQILSGSFLLVICVCGWMWFKSELQIDGSCLLFSSMATASSPSRSNRASAEQQTEWGSSLSSSSHMLRHTVVFLRKRSDRLKGMEVAQQQPHQQQEAAKEEEEERKEKEVEKEKERRWTISSSHLPTQEKERRIVLESTTLLNLDIFNVSLVVRSNVVLVHKPEHPFNIGINDSYGYDASTSASNWCGAAVRNIVFGEQGTIFYYILDERCLSSESPPRVTQRLVSYRRANLHPVVAGSNFLADSLLISYWWVGFDDDGARPSSSSHTILSPGSNTSEPLMAMVYGMDLTASGQQLVLSESVNGPQKSRITLLNTTGGQKLSMSTDADNLQGLALSPKKNRMYVADLKATKDDVVRILCADVPDSSAPPPSLSFDTVISFKSGVEPQIGDISFGAQSWDPEGRCLYFFDYGGRRLWSLVGAIDGDGAAGGATVTLVAGSGEEGGDDGKALNASFNGLKDIVVTPDGCNLFVSQIDGHLRWISMDFPCSGAERVRTIARYQGQNASYRDKGFWGLGLADGGQHLNLYVGSNDGQVFQLQVNKSSLHACVVAEAFRSSRLSCNVVIAIVLGIVGASLFLIGLLLCFYMRRARRTSKTHLPPTQPFVEAPTPHTSPPAAADRGEANVPLSSHLSADWPPEESSALHPTTVQEFSLSVLSDITDNFSQSCRIGDRGAFGEVFRAQMEGQHVAMKVMTGELTPGKRRQFRAEVNTLSRLHHGNLVELLGYCQEGTHSILVYPFFPGGSLHARLHHHTAGSRASATSGHPSPDPPLPPLTLAERLSITLQIAEGLRYLHHGANPPVIHRDIKSSNVLLGDGEGNDLRAVLADFGLARMMEKIFHEQQESAVSISDVVGTSGYMAPEYMREGKLTEKNDVYAFGVVVFEMLTGRRAVVINAAARQVESLIEWLETFFRNANVELPDAVLEACLRDDVASSYPTKKMVMEMLWLARECTQELDYLRPSMNAVGERISHLLSDAITRGGARLTY